MNEITAEDIQAAYKQFSSFKDVNVMVIPTPTRTFEIGESVRLGGLKEVVIAEILNGGKSYRIEFTRSVKSKKKPESKRGTMIAWWFDVEKMDFADVDATPIFAPHLPGQVSPTLIETLLRTMSLSGIVCDPRYQRGYVWSIEDQRNLIDSIFNRISIGTIILSRHSGYLHKETESVTYINLDGDEVTFPRREDNTSAVIDGQQRLTTIWRFVTNQFDYNGYYWCNLSLLAASLTYL